jgi:hypothetical protein
LNAEREADYRTTLMTDALVDPRAGVPSRAAVALGRLHADAAHDPTPATVEASVAEMESLQDTAGLIRSLPDTTAPHEVAVGARSLVQSGRYPLLKPPVEP